MSPQSQHAGKAQEGRGAGACTFLNGFIALVRFPTGNSIPVAKATALINQANRINLVLGC